MPLALADVSEFQGHIDWAAYGASNPAVVVRVHNSSRPDNYAQPNIAGARAHCSWRGFYQYLTAGADPVKAAHAFQATLGPTLPGEVMVLDLEEGAGDQRARRAAWLGALQDPVEWTYSGVYFARQRLPGVHVQWLAAYGQGEPTDSHTLWQNTNARRFAGIKAPCDGSLFNGTLAQLQALTNTTPTPPPLEDDMLTPEAQTWIEGRLDAHSLWVAQNLRAAIAAFDPATLAADVVKALPPAGTVVTQPMLEAALRTVLGSVDNTPPK